MIAWEMSEVLVADFCVGANEYFHFDELFEFK
jgi:hypothetical protein